MRKTMLTVLWIACALCLQAFAGVEAVSKHYDAANRVTGTSTFSVDDDAFAMEFRSRESNMRVVFRSDRDLVWVMNLDDQTYIEMTREQIKKLAAMKDQMMSQMGPQMEQMRKMLEERTKDMTPEQRELVMKSIPGGNMMESPSGESEAGPRYRKIAGGVSIGQWSCSHYQSDDSKDREEIWTVEPSEVGVTAGDMKVFKAFGDFFEPLTANLGSQMKQFYRVGSPEFEKAHGYSGIPVQIKKYDNGKLVETVKTESISNGSIPASRFELEKGLKKDDSMEKLNKMQMR